MVAAMKRGRPKFKLGKTVATPKALAVLMSAGESPMAFLDRHVCGDWGDVSGADWEANDRDLLDEGRLISAYHTTTGVKLWVITEADRSATTILLPEEY